MNFNENIKAGAVKGELFPDLRREIDGVSNRLHLYSVLMEAEEKGQITRQQFEAVKSLLTSQPEEYQHIKLNEVPLEAIDKVIDLLMESEEYKSYFTEQINTASSLQELIERCGSMPAIRTSGGEGILLYGPGLKEIMEGVTSMVRLKVGHGNGDSVQELLDGGRKYLSVPLKDFGSRPDTQYYVPRELGLRDKFEELLVKAANEGFRGVPL